MRLLLAAVLIAAIFAPISTMSQQFVRTTPGTTTTQNNASSTITTTSTFQKVFSSGGRYGCTVQNNGTHNMYVTEGLGIANSTTSNSIILPAGAFYYCAMSGIVLTGEIDITGTTGDAFYAAQY